MKLGVVIDVKPTFINELLEDWQACYNTDVFSFKEIKLPVSQGRINQWRRRQSLKQFVNSNDIVFFEWAAHSAIAVSHMQLQTPLVVRLHSFELYEFAPLINWNTVSRIIFISKAMQQRFIKLYPQHANKTRLVYHGKSLTKFKPEVRQFGGNLGMLCNMTPIKRVYDLILTLHELKQRGYNLHLHLAGEPRKGGIDERYYASMHRAVEKLDLHNNVTFYGFVKDPENWLKKIDVFISNSFWEGQQVALLEAMATGCFCLSHFWDGAEEILPPENIFSAESDLQQKIINYCEMEDIARKTQQALMRHITEETFNLELGLAGVKEVIEELRQHGK